MRLRLALRNVGLVALGAGAGSLASFLLFSRRREQKTSSSAGPIDHPSFKFGAPIGDVLRTFDGFAVSYDTRNRNPRWVLERLTKDSSNGDGNRQDVQFKEDDLIEPRFRAKLSDYSRTGFDRGHMAPAANHKGSQKSMEDTFTLSNVSPQVGKGFNRDYWARFERFVKTLVSSADEVYVVTGPLYVPSKLPAGQWAMAHPMIGEPPALVAVPTHFYKVLLAERSGLLGKQLVAGAFVMPNKEIDPDTPLSAFVVPLEALETVAGLKFFPEGLQDPGRRRALDDAALKWQQAGRAQLKGGQSHHVGLLEGPTPAATSSSTALVEQRSSGENGRGRAGRKPRRNKNVVEEQPGFLQSVAGSLGSTHVCDHVACALPASDWYKAQKRA